VIAGIYVPVKELILLEKNATGMVIPSFVWIGMMNKRIPINEGIRNFIKSFRGKDFPLSFPSVFVKLFIYVHLYFIFC
jgi:hypothetical protein